MIVEIKQNLAGLVRDITEYSIIFRYYVIHILTVGTCQILTKKIQGCDSLIKTNEKESSTYIDQMEDCTDLSTQLYSK